jgi:predicted small lipoprotein YifL
MRSWPRATLRARAAAAVAIATLALAGCGQRGPLTLPSTAKPIQKLDRTAPASPPAPQPGAPATPPAAAPEAPAPSESPPVEPERRTENER